MSTKSTRMKTFARSVSQRAFGQHLARVTACLILLSLISGCQLVDMAKFSYVNAQSKHEWTNTIQSTQVPFKLINNHIIVPVSINDSEQLNFVLDSGAGATVITESHRSRVLDLKKGNEISISGAGAGFESVANIVEDLKISVGSVNLLGQSVINIPLSAMPFFNELEEAYFDGIIGYDFFRRFIVEINYDTMTVIFSEKDQHEIEIYEASKNWQQLPLEISGSMPYLNASVGLDTKSSIAVKLLVDTGSTGSFSLIPDTHPGLKEPDKYYTRTAQGLTGDIDSHVSSFSFLGLGQFQLEEVIGSYSMSGEESENDNHGLLGNQAMNRFNLIFDYQNNRLFLQPNHRFGIPISPDKSGLRIMPHARGGIVKGIADGTAAASLNLNVGDIVTRFDGEAVTEQTISQLQRRLASTQNTVRLCWLKNDTEHCEGLELSSRF